MVSGTARRRFGLCYAVYNGELQHTHHHRRPMLRSTSQTLSPCSLQPASQLLARRHASLSSSSPTELSRLPWHAGMQQLPAAWGTKNPDFPRFPILSPLELGRAGGVGGGEGWVWQRRPRPCSMHTAEFGHAVVPRHRTVTQKSTLYRL